MKRKTPGEYRSFYKIENVYEKKNISGASPPSFFPPFLIAPDIPSPPQ
jgi:hypothetical protein